MHWTVALTAAQQTYYTLSEMISGLTCHECSELHYSWVSPGASRRSVDVAEFTIYQMCKSNEDLNSSKAYVFGRQDPANSWK